MSDVLHEDLDAVRLSSRKEINSETLWAMVRASEDARSVLSEMERSTTAEVRQYAAEHHIEEITVRTTWTCRVEIIGQPR